MSERTDPPPGQGAIGVKIQARTRPVVYNPLESIWLGFRRAVVGRSAGLHDGLETHAVAELREALDLLVRG